MKKIPLTSSLFFAFILLSLNGCVSSSQHNALRSQVSQQVNTLQTEQANSASDISTMRQEVADLKGQLAAIQNAVDRAGGAQKLGATLEKHNNALRMIQSQLAMDLHLDEDIAAPGMAPISTGNSTSQNSGTTSLPPGFHHVPIQPSSSPSSAAALSPASATLKQTNTANKQQTSTSSAKPANASVADALYNTGMDAYNKGQYKAALNSFTDFTKTYPGNKQASQAFFWKGECHYQLKDYANAALSYESVISGYKNSPKAPAAYLKQGNAFLQLGKKSAAKQRLNELIKKYPKSPEATRAKKIIAEKKL